jgi:hypothetical protein
VLQGTLEELLMEYHETLSKSERFRGKILIKRYDTNAPIRPWEGFDLNLATAISAAGLVATYLVILIQFRLSGIDVAISEWSMLYNNTSFDNNTI